MVEWVSGRPWVVLATAATAAIALAACGSSPGSHHNSASSDPQFKLARCMRSHGVSNFPDPTRGPGGEGFSITSSPGSSIVNIDGVAFSGPAFSAAVKTCKLFGGGSGPPPISEAEKVDMVKFARCMRDHGVPGYPDPIFPPGGGVERKAVPDSTVNSPAFQRAVAMCNGKGG